MELRRMEKINKEYIKKIENIVFNIFKELSI